MNIDRVDFTNVIGIGKALYKDDPNNLDIWLQWSRVDLYEGALIVIWHEIFSVPPAFLYFDNKDSFVVSRDPVQVPIYDKPGMIFFKGLSPLLRSDVIRAGTALSQFDREFKSPFRKMNLFKTWCKWGNLNGDMEDQAVWNILRVRPYNLSILGNEYL